MSRRLLSGLFQSLADKFRPDQPDRLQQVTESLQALSRELSERDQEIKTLQEQVTSLRNGIQAGRQVDLVDFGQLRVFMYVDDMGYRVIPPEYKNNVSGPVDRDLSQPARTPQERYDDPGEPLISLLLSHYWVHGLEFAYLDVGCQYGTSAMATAQVILASGRRNPVFAFDPGTAGALVPFNLVLNGMEDRVTFEAVAISNHNLPGIVYAEAGQSENNRIVNRDLRTEAVSRVIRCKTVDQILTERGVATDLIVKLDTQGGEPEVFQGMERTLRERNVLCVSEFVPDAIATRVDPTDWLSLLSRDFHFFDIVDNDMYLKRSHKLTPVDSAALPAFVSAVANRQPAYTDLLMVPRKLPGYAALAERLTA